MSTQYIAKCPHKRVQGLKEGKETFDIKLDELKSLNDQKNASFEFQEPRINYLKVTNPGIELVKRMKEGDVAAFDDIYNHYCHKLHRFVLMYLKQEEDAEEIVQEVFVKIWQSREKIDIYASFESFLFTIAYNATMSLLRKRMSETRSREHLRSMQQIDSADEVINEIQFKELTRKVEHLLTHLTPRQKEIYTLSREDGLSHEEIAKKLNISTSTVNNHLVNILKYLKSHIDSSLAVNILFICLFLS